MKKPSLLFSLLFTGWEVEFISNRFCRIYWPHCGGFTSQLQGCLLFICYFKDCIRYFLLFFYCRYQAGLASNYNLSMFKFADNYSLYRHISQVCVTSSLLQAYTRFIFVMCFRKNFTETETAESAQLFVFLISKKHNVLFLYLYFIQPIAISLS